MRNDQGNEKSFGMETGHLRVVDDVLLFMQCVQLCAGGDLGIKDSGFFLWSAECDIDTRKGTIDFTCMHSCGTVRQSMVVG